MRILSWNILHGGGSRRRHILDAIAAHQPHIVTLQEFRPADGPDDMLDGLNRLGLGQQYVAPTEGRRDNGLLVAARLPFEAAPFPLGVAGPIHCIQARFGHEPVTALRLIAVRFPQREAQIPLFNALLDLPADYLQGQSILIGDFNCGIPFEDSDTRTFYATALFQQLLRQGWVDAWRSRHRHAREFSWISHPRRNGFRYDHALASAHLDARIAAVEYDHAVREAGYSDHSALLLDIADRRPATI
jgi:exodeoxyribonuclease-3